MASKVTLAELRREAERVGLVGESVSESPAPICQGWGIGFGDYAAFGKTRMGARRRMLNLLRALPDGALKEG